MANSSTLKKRVVILALAAAAAPAFVPSPAHASLFWSGANTWIDDGTTADWGTVSGGPYTVSPWVGGSNAVFEGTAGTVTVSGTIVSINSILFTTDGYTLSNGGTLTLTGAGGNVTMGYGTTSNDTFSSITAGTVGLTLNTAGTFTATGTNGSLVLNSSAANTFTGGITVNAGILMLDASNFATATNLVDPSNVLVLDGGTLNLKANGTAATTHQTLGNLTVGGGNSFVTESANGKTMNLALGTITRNVINATTAPLAPVNSYTNPTINFGSNNSTVFITTTTPLTGVGGFNDPSGTIIGPWATANSGTLLNYATINGSSQIVAYTGATAADGGGNNFANMTSATTNYSYFSNSVGTISLTGSQTGNTLAFTGTTGSIAHTVDFGGNTLTLNGLLQGSSNNVTMQNGTLQIGANKELVLTTGGQSLTVSANIVDSLAGTSTLTWNSLSGGTLILAGTANTYSGGTYLNSFGSSGRNDRGIVINNSTSLGTGPVYVNGLIQFGTNLSSGTVTLPNNVWYLNADIIFNQGVSGGAAINLGTGNVFLGGNRTILNTEDTLTIGGVVSDGGNGYGITYNGNRALVLAAANTYSGNTVDNSTGTSANELTLTNSLALQDSTLVLNTNSVAQGLFFSTLVTSLNFTFGGLSGSHNLTLLESNSSGGITNTSVNLSVGNNNQNTTYFGILSDGSGTAHGSLSKIGTGTLTLGGLNTYRGATTVNAGMLSIASAGTLSATSGVTINGGNFNYNSTTAFTQPLSFGASGGVLSGTGTISTSTVGGVTAGASAVVSPGNGPTSTGSLTFTTGLTFNTGSTYQWNNYEGNTAGVVGTNFSSLVNGGSTIAINDGTLALDFNATTDFVSGLWSSSHTWDIISGGSVTGSFANITLSGSSLSLTNAANTLSQGTFSDAVTGGDLILTWTPTAGGGVPAGTGSWHNGTGDGKWTTNTGSGNNWLTGIPNAIDQVATFDDTAMGGPGTVDLDGAKTVGGLNLNTALVGYTLGLPATPNTLTLQNSSGTALIAVGNNGGAGAAHTINALLNLASNTSVTLATGTSLNLVGSVSGTGTLSVSGTGVLKLSAAAGNSYAGTNVSGGTLLVANTSGSATGSSNVVMTGGTLGGSGIISGTVNASSGTETLFPSATLVSPTATTTLTVGGLTTGGGTTLQFNLVTPGNALNSTVSSSDRIVVSGSGGLVLNGGTVNLTNHSTGATSLGFYKVMSINGGIGGTGLSSLTLPATVNNVAYTFDTTHDAGFVDIHRGFLGDVDDSGFVDINDLATLAAHWQQAGGWAQGNFLGDAVVDINDLSVLAAHWQSGITSFGEAADSLSGTSESFQQAVAGIVFGGASSVPEPTSLALLGMGAAGLLW